MHTLGSQYISFLTSLLEATRTGSLQQLHRFARVLWNSLAVQVLHCQDTASCRIPHVADLAQQIHAMELVHRHSDSHQIPFARHLASPAGPRCNQHESQFLETKDFANEDPVLMPTDVSGVIHSS